MQDDTKVEINLEMDIADFSSKTVKRIDIHDVVGRTDSHRAGAAIVMTFVDGSTGTILIRSGEGAHITVTPYARPKMANYSIVEEEGVAPVPLER